MTKTLLIEDNEDNRISMTILLENAEFQVSFAINGLDGLEKAQAESPDVILLDIQLPDINGFEVLERLLNIESTRSIPVIAVTSSAMAGDRQQLLSAGCRGYIEKPIDPMRFVEQIKKYIGI
jgi:two-component system cell cycle response regulator DivK